MVSAYAMLLIGISLCVDHGMVIFLDVIWTGVISYFTTEIEMLL